MNKVLKSAKNLNQYLRERVGEVMFNYNLNSEGTLETRYYTKADL